MIEKIHREWNERMKKKRRKQRLIYLSLFLIVVVAFICWNGNRNKQFMVTHYKLTSNKIKGTLTIALLSDLHCAEYGEKNEKLISAIRNESPDLILMAGDMVNDTNLDIHVAVDLCQSLTEIAPVYYCYGNHEGTLMHDGIDGVMVAVDESIRETGAIFFDSGSCTTSIDGNIISLAGIPQGISGYEKWGYTRRESLEKAEGYRILVSHHPDLYYEKLYDADIDLALAGHYHGGLVRLPVLGPLYHPNGGFFPKYAEGLHQLQKAKLVVSRGLGDSGSIPRVNNPPELVIIEIEEEGGR